MPPGRKFFVSQQMITPKRLTNVSDSYPMESQDGTKIPGSPFGKIDSCLQCSKQVIVIMMSRAAK